jgi:hypothetical protein
MSCTRRPGPPGAVTWTRTADCFAEKVVSAKQILPLIARVKAASRMIGASRLVAACFVLRQNRGPPGDGPLFWRLVASPDVSPATCWQVAGVCQANGVTGVDRATSCRR